MYDWWSRMMLKYGEEIMLAAILLGFLAIIYL
jgi:hypothetical protein